MSLSLSEFLLVIISPQIDEKQFHILSNRADGSYPAGSPTTFGWRTLYVMGRTLADREDRCGGPEVLRGKEKILGMGSCQKSWRVYLSNPWRLQQTVLPLGRG